MNAGPNSSTALEPEEDQQRLVKGRTWGTFQLLAMVGRGSFGEVYRAWDTHLQREVGLKILLPRSTNSGAQFDELLREARALAAVRHPNIVSVYGIDQHDGLVGFWTDFVHGKTLALLVHDQGPFGYREAALVGLDVCKALSAVHRAGLLHRDIKAENVMREEGGRILLMDFGLSTLPHLQIDLAGTPRYMAPELFTGATATVSSDIYSVGVLLFYLVAGSYPARHTGDEHEIQRNAGREEVTEDAIGIARAFAANLSASRSVLDYRPDLPDTLARTIDKAIHPDPQQRFHSAGALSTALSGVLAAPLAENEAMPEVPRLVRKTWMKWSYAAILAVFLLAATGVFTHLRNGRGISGASANSAPGINEKYLKADALLSRSDKRKNVSDATVLLKEVLTQDPNFALAQAELGRAYFLDYRVSRTPGLLDQARAACNRALEIDATLAPPYITLARIDAIAGNTALATQQIGKALKLDPRGAEAYGAQAEIYDAEGRSADAMASVQRAMDLDPEYWRWPVLLGKYYFNGGKLQEASNLYQRAVAVAPDNAIALLDLGLVFIQLERLDDARTNLEKAAQIEPSFAAYSALGELLQMEGRYADSAEMNKKAVAFNPTDYSAWGNLASAYLWTPGDHHQATDAYHKAIALAEVSRKETPNDPLLLATLGGYYAAVDQADRSLPLLRQAVALAPNNPDVLFQAGYGYETLHHRSDAIHLLARSLALGYHSDQFQRSPELASLREDKQFQGALRLERAKESLDKH